MRRTLVLVTLGVTVAVIAGSIACSKSKSPTAPQPSCSVSTTSIAFDTVSVGSSSATRTFSIQNDGGGTLAGSVSESCSDFEIVSGSGAYRLGAGETHSVVLRFVPQSAGAKSCQVTTGCSQVTLTGVAITGSCELAPTSLDFGTVTVGQFADLTFTLTNTGATTIAANVTESCADFSLLGTTAYNLGPGQAATFTVRFSPGSAGPLSCTVNTGSPGCPSIQCSGSGVAVSGDCDLIPDGITFGEQAIGGRYDATFKIRNNGSGRLVGTVTESCEEFSIPGATSYDLAPGAEQTFIVRFEPLYEGPKLCMVNTGPGCAALQVSGIGIVGCELAPTSLDFGYVKFGEAGYRTFTLTNNTNSTLSGTFNNAYPFEVRNQTGGTTYSVPAHSSGTFGVTFRPPTSCDSILYERTVETGSTLCNEVVLRGVGTYGCDCTVSPTTIDFGNVVVGESSSAVFLDIRNDTHTSGLSGTIRVLSGDFYAPATYQCPTYPPGSCAGCFDRATILFRPESLGPQTGRIVVETPIGCPGPGAACDTVTVTGVGVTAVERR